MKPPIALLAFVHSIAYVTATMRAIYTKIQTWTMENLYNIIEYHAKITFTWISSMYNKASDTVKKQN